MVAIDVNGKTKIYSAAVIEALAMAAKETGGPDINAAIAALADAQAYLIASIKDRSARRLAESHAREALGKKIAEMVNARIVRDGDAKVKGGREN